MIKWKIPKGIDEKYKELQTVLDILKAKNDVANFEAYLKYASIDDVISYRPTRKLKTHWKLETRQDIKIVHGIDLEKEMVNELTKEIANEIEMEVLRKILNGKVEN